LRIRKFYFGSGFGSGSGKYWFSDPDSIPNCLFWIQFRTPIQQHTDPDADADLEQWMKRYTHKTSAFKTYGFKTLPILKSDVLWVYQLKLSLYKIPVCLNHLLRIQDILGWIPDLLFLHDDRRIRIRIQCSIRIRINRYLWLVDPDPGGPKTCGSGSATLV